MAANEGAQSKVETGPTVTNSLLGTLPFALFGIVCLSANIQPAFHPIYIFVAFSLIILLGLVIGLARDFPLWTYSFLGWSIVMAWWWMMMPVDTFSGRYTPTTHNQFIGWRSWLILLGAIGIGLAMARSVHPLRRMIRGIGEDWTLLSFMIYTFAAFGLLIYDENHHPYLAAFMLGSTLAISLGAWFYLQSLKVWNKIVSLLSGFVIAYLIGYFCYSTWDWAAYHGYPESPPQAWYTILLNGMNVILFWMVILFWPAIIGFIQRRSRRDGAV